MHRSDPIRIAMWSGPRNISTAMMRAWGNRPDALVVDEPFYAYYLKATGKKHPGAEEVIATGETDWRRVVAQLTSPVPNGKRIFFQKQMTHHLLLEVDREWLASVTNCFPIGDGLAKSRRAADQPCPERQAHFFPKTDDASSPAGGGPGMACQRHELLSDRRRIGEESSRS